MNLTGKRVLILGATSGIAREVTRELARRGCLLALAGRGRERLDTVAADARVRGAKLVSVHEADLADPATHVRTLDAAAQALGGLDAAILAYGVLGDQKQAEADFATTRAILDTNFTSAASWIQLLAARFEAQGSGHITAIGSVAGDRGRQSNYVYGASKGALDILLQGVRHRLAPKGIGVLTIKPGFVDTPMTAHIPKTPMFASPAAVAAGIVKAIESGKSVAYLPARWRLIMWIIRNVPDFVFHKTKL